MKRIFKYTLKAKDVQDVVIPYPNRILSVTEQYGSIVVYALVDDCEDRDGEIYNFQIRGTGHDASGLEGYTFLDTVKIHGGDLMFHVFYIHSNIIAK